VSLDAFIQGLRAMYVRFPDDELDGHRRRARGRVDRAHAERHAARRAFATRPSDTAYERVVRAEIEWEDAVAVGQEFCR
jgi:hypothetical protein